MGQRCRHVFIILIDVVVTLVFNLLTFRSMLGSLAIAKDVSRVSNDHNIFHFVVDDSCGIDLYCKVSDDSDKDE